MAGSQTVPSASVRTRETRQARLRRASLTIVIVLVVQFGLGMTVNLYVALPEAGRPGHGSWFGNGVLLACHAALGLYLLLAAILVLIRAIMARNRTVIVTSAAGLVAILFAAAFGAGFTEKLTAGYSLGMAITFAVALGCYVIGLYATNWSAVEVPGDAGRSS